MKKTTFVFTLIACLSTPCLAKGNEQLLPQGEEQFIFESGDKKTAAFRGSLTVPENRNAPNSRMIKIRYVRFPATGENKGNPIIYLSGGPGGSGISTAKYRRFDMFMALRAYGDVIALDQRGIKASEELPNCTSDIKISYTVNISDGNHAKAQREAFKQCLAFWKDKGVDVAGYNTVQNAKDIDDLRKHLGAEKVTLWGISYGSHLALTALKEIEHAIDKVIIASAEGLNQTVKQPARTDAYFSRVQAAINTQPSAKAQLPNIKELMRRVHDKLDKNPKILTLTLKNGSSHSLLFQRRDMQKTASYMVSDPKRVAMLLGLYHEIDKGNFAPLAKLLSRYHSPDEAIEFHAMSTLTDYASGMTAEKKLQILHQAKTSLLKDNLNSSFHIDGVAPELDLGDAFRSKPTSAVPLLLLSGTLDGRTYIESQLEAVSNMPNVTPITVKNAGHNLFMSSPEVQEAINRFMEGRPVKDSVITIPLPDFSLKN